MRIFHTQTLRVYKMKEVYVDASITLKFLVDDAVKDFDEIIGNLDYSFTPLNDDSVTIEYTDMYDYEVKSTRFLSFYPDEAEEIHTVASDTMDYTYKVMRVGDKWTCECKSYAYNGGQCKHIKKITSVS